MFLKATVLSLIVLFSSNINIFAKGKEVVKKESIKYNIQIEDHPAQSALVIKGKVAAEKAGDAIGSNIHAVGAHLEKIQVKPAGAPFTRTYSFKDGILEFETGFPIVTRAKTQGSIVATELPKTKVAKTTHVGDQSTSEHAYNAIHTWMNANGKKPAGAPWEVYTAKDRMEVYFPIQ
jgi:effector-binding domain-containing protein